MNVLFKFVNIQKLKYDAVLNGSGYIRLTKISSFSILILFLINYFILISIK